MLVRERIVTSTRTEDGAGVSIRRLFPGPDIQSFDPFALFDEFFLGPNAGFPDHPHGGFEAVTYMLEGAFRHKDNLGNDSTIVMGGAQRFTAGKGIVHSEMPGVKGLNHGIQLWINLPRYLKSIEPSYQQVEPFDLPTEEYPNVIIRTIIGEDSPVVLHSEIVFQDIILKARKKHEVRVPDGHAGFLYVVIGRLLVHGDILPSEKAFVFEGENRLEILARQHTRFLFVSGKPLGEEIVLLGSFVR